ncbi:MAG: hypothetical protein R6W69_12695 [Anaerolineales bacterium]
MIHVKIFTANHVIRGLLNTSGERLTDVLNNGTKSSVILKEAEVARLLWLEKAPPSKLDNVSVTKADILLAMPVEQDRTEKSIFRKTTRQLFLITLLVQNFEVMGRIHMTERTNIDRILLVRAEDFIPLTDARATYMPVPKINFSSEMIIFNKAKVSLLGENFPVPPAASK